VTPAMGATTRLFLSWYGPMRIREINEALLRSSGHDNEALLRFAHRAVLILPGFTERAASYPQKHCSGKRQSSVTDRRR
jgi:hypothetical protein